MDNILVYLYDGRVLKFPPGTARAVIDRVVREQTGGLLPADLPTAEAQAAMVGDLVSAINAAGDKTAGTVSQALSDTGSALAEAMFSAVGALPTDKDDTAQREMAERIAKAIGDVAEAVRKQVKTDAKDNSAALLKKLDSIQQLISVYGAEIVAVLRAPKKVTRDGDKLVTEISVKAR